MICCVIPTYKARSTICTVVDGALKFVDVVVVVDDACPERSGEVVEERHKDHPSVIVITHGTNKGVGGATKTGFAKALQIGAGIIIKLDADNQMDTKYISSIVSAFDADESLEFIKGNRFIDTNLLKTMPKVRLVGNSILSLLLKFSSGYWNMIDPTNGYFAFRASTLRQIAWQALSEQYFFEGHILCTLGMKKARIAEMEMPAIYGSEVSSLSITKIIGEFPPKLFRLCLKRVLFQYFINDVNLGSLYLLFGLVLASGGVLLGAYEWIESVITRVPRTTGTVMLAVLPFLMGFQLLLNALMYDVQFGAKTIKLLPRRANDESASDSVTIEPASRPSARRVSAAP